MNIKKVISEKGWTLERLAAEMSNTRDKDNPNKKGVSQATVSQIVGKYGNPTIDKLKEIASIIGVTLEELVSDGDSKINGYVEVKGTIFRIKSVDDLKRLVELSEESKE